MHSYRPFLAIWANITAINGLYLLIINKSEKKKKQNQSNSKKLSISSKFEHALNIYDIHLHYKLWSQGNVHLELKVGQDVFTIRNP